MGLRDFKIARTDISAGGTTLSVRGMSFDDVMHLADTYGPQMAVMFGRVQSGNTLDSADVRTIIGNLAKEAPDMVAAAIALATDDYDEDTVEIARKLPFPVQLDVLDAMFQRTFASEAEVKKLIESVTRMIAGVSGALTTVGSSLPTGTGGSAEA